MTGRHFGNWGQALGRRRLLRGILELHSRFSKKFVAAGVHGPVDIYPSVLIQNHEIRRDRQKKIRVIEVEALVVECCGRLTGAGIFRNFACRNHHVHQVEGLAVREEGDIICAGYRFFDEVAEDVVALIRRNAERELREGAAIDYLISEKEYTRLGAQWHIWIEIVRRPKDGPRRIGLKDDSEKSGEAPRGDGAAGQIEKAAIVEAVLSRPGIDLPTAGNANVESQPVRYSRMEYKCPIGPHSFQSAAIGGLETRDRFVARPLQSLCAHESRQTADGVHDFRTNLLKDFGWILLRLQRGQQARQQSQFKVTAHRSPRLI